MLTSYLSMTSVLAFGAYHVSLLSGVREGINFADVQKYTCEVTCGSVLV